MHYEEIETKFRCQEALKQLQLQRTKSSEEKKEDSSFKDIKFLMENKSEIFNITPPNAKADDKLKDSRKYKLYPEAEQQKWRGYKNSSLVQKSARTTTAESSDHIDPFSQNWTFSSKNEKLEKDQKVEISKFQF